MTSPADVISRDASIETSAGTASGVLLSPPGDRRWPGVLFLTDIAGIRAAVIERATRLAASGYAVLVPNVFYRSGAPPFFTFPIDFNDEANRQRFNAMTSVLTADAIGHDAAAYVNYFHRQHVLQPGPIAVVGHCFSGAVALRMAAAEGAAVSLVASFHGGSLYTDKSTSPHLALPQVSARLYFAHATEDRSMSSEAIIQLEHALAEWGGTYQSETIRAHHGWTMADHPAYQAAPSDKSFQTLTRLLAETFPKTS